MQKSIPSRRKKLALFWARLVCFALILLIVLLYGAYVFAPKYAYGMCPMLNLYFQPRNTVDVLSLGTSLAYCGVNTNTLWQEYGIAAYNLCSAEQPFWVSYYALREALKTQTPRVILLDTRPAVYQQEHSTWARTVLGTYGILGLENRVGAMLACAETPGDALRYIIGLPQVHKYYPEITPDAFRFPPDNEGRGGNWKGYIEEDAVHQYARPSLVWSKEEEPLGAKQETYARKIFELAKARGIPVLLVAFPNPDYKMDHAYCNRLFAIAAEYGFDGINYNLPTLRFGLNFTKDFADWEHLNVRGSMNFSRKLGTDLMAAFSLPDRRGDIAYASYDAAAADWYARLADFQSAPKED